MDSARLIPKLIMGPESLRHHLETHTRQTPHFVSYPMDMTWILQHQVYLLSKCHIHIITTYVTQHRTGHPDYRAVQLRLTSYQ